MKKACLRTADILEEVVEQVPDAELVRLCVSGLRDFADRYDVYASTATTSARFVNEFAEKVKTIVDAFPQHDMGDPAKRKLIWQNMQDKRCPSKYIEGASIYANRCHDEAFALVESMVVIVREMHLRMGAGDVSDVHGDLMSFFEARCQWRADDDTLVSDYYYRRVPIAVLHDLAAAHPGRCDAEAVL